MKKIILSAIVVFTGVQMQAQDFFAVTGLDTKQILFKNIQSFDLNNGRSGDVILDSKSNVSVISQRLNAPLQETRATFHNAQASQIAGMAFNGTDVVYTPMFSSNIYVINTKTKAIQLVENETILTKACDVGSHITRMTVGKDGNVYALNNASSQLIKISGSNNQYTVENLGALRDVSGNQEISLHDMRSGFGGDMIADADNNFYVFSAAKNVFKINSKSLSATFVGTVQGLPEDFTLNGASVNKDGKVVVASAKAQGFYLVDMSTLDAKKMEGNFDVPVYDLASNYFLNDQKESAEQLVAGISIYPTKVNNQIINVKVTDENIRGNVSVEVIDYLGNKLVKTNINSVRQNAEYPVRLGGVNQGAYIVNVLSSNGVVIHSEKIIVAR